MSDVDCLDKARGKYYTKGDEDDTKMDRGEYGLSSDRLTRLSAEQSGYQAWSDGIIVGASYCNLASRFGNKGNGNETVTAPRNVGAPDDSLDSLVHHDHSCLNCQEIGRAHDISCGKGLEVRTYPSDKLRRLFELALSDGIIGKAIESAWADDINDGIGEANELACTDDLESSIGKANELACADDIKSGICKVFETSWADDIGKVLEDDGSKGWADGIHDGIGTVQELVCADGIRSGSGNAEHNNLKRRWADDIGRASDDNRAVKLAGRSDACNKDNRLACEHENVKQGRVFDIARHSHGGMVECRGDSVVEHWNEDGSPDDTTGSRLGNSRCDNGISIGNTGDSDFDTAGSRLGNRCGSENEMNSLVSTTLEEKDTAINWEVRVGDDAITSWSGIQSDGSCMQCRTGIEIMRAGTDDGIERKNDMNYVSDTSIGTGEVCQKNESATINNEMVQALYEMVNVSRVEECDADLGKQVLGGKAEQLNICARNEVNQNDNPRSLRRAYRSNVADSTRSIFDNKLLEEMSVQDFDLGETADGRKDHVEKEIETVITKYALSDVLSRESVRINYSYSGHQSWQLGRVLMRVTDTCLNPVRGFGTVLGLI